MPLETVVVTWRGGAQALNRISGGSKTAADENKTREILKVQ